jgi:hypothetical protein
MISSGVRLGYRRLNSCAIPASIISTRSSDMLGVQNLRMHVTFAANARRVAQLLRDDGGDHVALGLGLAFVLLNSERAARPVALPTGHNQGGAKDYS